LHASIWYMSEDMAGYKRHET